MRLDFTRMSNYHMTRPNNWNRLCQYVTSSIKLHLQLLHFVIVSSFSPDRSFLDILLLYFCSHVSVFQGYYILLNITNNFLKTLYKHFFPPWRIKHCKLESRNQWTIISRNCFEQNFRGVIVNFIFLRYVCISSSMIVQIWFEFSPTNYLNMFITR